jgi:hypothetical protein
MGNTCGPDTVHLTFKEGGGRSPLELAALLQEFQVQYDLPTAAVTRDRGVQGFANAAVDQAAGLRLDWTRPGEEGHNAGCFCLQIKGQWFEAADGETAADFLQLMQAYGIYRCTRIDFQQTIKTKKYLTPWWIDQFEKGALRVVGKKHWEPRGARNHWGDYPEGATLYHGSRSSERYARQYDKHLQQGDTLQRRRDEVELKGQSARDLWDQMHGQLLECEQLGASRGHTLHAFTKSTIRALLPIRDTSRWIGSELPKKWAQVAKEPTNWATLFDDEPLQVKPRERKLTTLLKSYRYCKGNFAAPVSLMTANRFYETLEATGSREQASEDAYGWLVDEFMLAANEDRVMELCGELPPSRREAVRQIWFGMLRTAASNQEDERD